MQRLLGQDQWASAVEYALFLGLLALAMLGGLALFANNLENSLTDSATAISRGGSEGGAESAASDSTTTPPNDATAVPQPGSQSQAGSNPGNGKGHVYDHAIAPKQAKPIWH